MAKTILGLIGILAAAAALYCSLVLYLIEPRPEETQHGETMLAYKKQLECEQDVRCASYDRNTGVWVWKPGQQPPPQPIIIKLQN